ncbi:hypothetical protein DUI87_24469 [Hirundo rustica rustica]|uniref:Proline-rich transmembrane protein 3/4 domain-containing protein n=1 Tax=Hirundo rustica rustica TaxID=333673 RepID=A0A3M0JDP1_HIRRU|nr:hypothetical protein DUI87_24469 [Hirundo rustica rustica]
MNFNVWNIKEMLSTPTALGTNKFSGRSNTASDYSSLSDSQLLFGSQFCPENLQSAAAPLELGTQLGQQNSQDSEPSIFTKYQTKPQLFDEETREKSSLNFGTVRVKSVLENFEVNKNKIKDKYDREVLSSFISSIKDRLQELQVCFEKFEEMFDSKLKSSLVCLETLSKTLEDAFQSHCSLVLKALTDKSQMEQALLEMERRLAAKDVEILDVKSSIQLLKEGLESLPAQLNDQFLKACKELDFLKLWLLPEEDVGSPQQVRGAVGPVRFPNATKTTPHPTAHPTTGTLEARHPDTPGTQTPASSTATPSATWRQAGMTPQPLPRDPTSPQPQSSRAPPALGANATGLRWAELQRQLGFSWEAHVYGVAAVFLLLALGCLAGLAGTAILRPPHLPHVVGAHGLLLAACLLRAAFLLLDPYGARGRLPAPALLLLNTAPFPLLLTAFALLLQRLQRLAQFQLLPSRLRGLPALGTVAALQSAVMGAADLLPPRLGLTAALGLQALGCVAGALLLLGGLWGCWRVLRAPCEGPGPQPGARALLAAAVAGLPVCGLQLYSAVWLRGVLGPHGRFSRPSWAAQLWLRIGELGTAAALLAAAAEPVCCRCRRRSPAGHSCWAKALRYFCAGRKADAPEYPNNCYDWAGGSTGGSGVERTPANDISKNLIRNPAEQLPLRALKDSNEVWAAGTGMPGLSPKCPNTLAARSCAAFEQGSSPSLGELIFRPPSPIDLRRSIDQALCRRHLLHDGLFGRPRRGSGSSLHGSPAPDKTPSSGRMVRCSSLTELPGRRQPPGSITVTVTASASSLESSSLKISWNPWRHGLSSPDSLPLDEAPSRAPLLVPAGAPGWEREGPRAFPALGKAVDSRSLSSDTIEL